MTASDVPRHYWLSLREQDSGEWTVEVIRARGDIALDAFRRYDLNAAISEAIGVMCIDRNNELRRDATDALRESCAQMEAAYPELRPTDGPDGR